MRLYECSWFALWSSSYDLETKGFRSERALKWELPCSNCGIRPENKKCRIISPPGTAPGAMVNLKEKGGIVGEFVGSDDELHSVIEEAYEILKPAMSSVFLLHGVLLRDSWRLWSNLAGI